ncbi:MAG TPA: chorismate mutase [Gemmatimonadaceae bacterium]
MGERRVRAIRGATTVERDDADLVRAATRELLEQIVARNALETDDIISVIFTVTADLRSEFPAHAARALGWVDVPLLCTMEIPVPGSLAHCIRILLHVESDRDRDGIAHVYLRGARVLRPDLAE